MGQDEGKQRWRDRLEGFGLEIGRGTIIGLLIKALLWGGGLLLGAAVVDQAVALAGSTVPAWILFITSCLTVFLAIVVGVLLLRHRRAKGTGSNLAESTAAELEGRVSELDAEVERRESYSRHLGDILDHFQRVLAGDIEGVSVPEFVERRHSPASPRRPCLGQIR
jgi:membrane protein implicated in regulation of membrane protease activity